MKKIIIFLTPILVLINLLAFSVITDLLRQKSDIAVIFGVLSTCITIAANYLLINFIKKQFKQKTK